MVANLAALKQSPRLHLQASCIFLLKVSACSADVCCLSELESAPDAEQLPLMPFMYHPHLMDATRPFSFRGGKYTRLMELPDLVVLLWMQSERFCLINFNFKTLIITCHHCIAFYYK